eukprot:688817-Hanusia_phi.AAC.1
MAGQLNGRHWAAPGNFQSRPSSLGRASSHGVWPGPARPARRRPRRGQCRSSLGQGQVIRASRGQSCRGRSPRTVNLTRLVPGDRGFPGPGPGPDQ